MKTRRNDFFLFHDASVHPRRDLPWLSRRQALLCLRAHIQTRTAAAADHQIILLVSWWMAMVSACSTDWLVSTGTVKLQFKQ